MGYFKRKLDRARCRELVRQVSLKGESQEPWRRWDGIRLSTTSDPCFLRFAASLRHWDSGKREGVFAAAYRLLRDSELERIAADQIEQTLDWFERNLPVPDFDEPSAIFFFKSDAGESARRIWHLVWVLRENDLLVDMIRVDNPGRVLYEDEYQVAAIPWSDTSSL